MMKRLLAVVLATVTLLTGSLGVSASEVTSQPESNTTTTTNTEEEDYKVLKWGKNKISEVGKKVTVGDYEEDKWRSESKIDQSYKIKVDKLSDITIKFKCNNNVTSDIQMVLWSKDNTSLYSCDTASSYFKNPCAYYYDNTSEDELIDGKVWLADLYRDDNKNPKDRTYKIMYKSLPKGEYIIQIVLRGKKNTIGKELGGTLTLSKKKAYVGQVNGVKVKKSGKKYTITWNKADKAKKYEYYYIDSALRKTKTKTISASKCSTTYTATGKAKGYQTIYVRAINGKHKGVWSKIPVGKYANN